MGNKIITFTDLDAWKESHKLVLKVYQLTSKFPKEETYSMTSQMRRCAVSITSNIAQGFNRKNYHEKKQFYYISKGSVAELQNLLYIARDTGSIDNEFFDELFNSTNTVHKIISGLIKYTKQYPVSHNS
jgi:four helix bundle protein